MNFEMKKIWIVLLCAFLTTGLVSGCSTGDRNSSNGINAGPDADPNGGGGNANGTCTAAGDSGGLIDAVCDVLNGLGEDTPLEDLTDLINQLVDPDTGDLAPLTGALNDLTENELAALTEVVMQLSNNNGDGALDPLITALNGILSGGSEEGGGFNPTDVAGLLSAEGLAGLLGGGLAVEGGGDSDEQGLVNVVNDVVSNLGDTSQLEDVTDLVNQLTNPNGGDLEALTSVVNDLTSTEGGLGVLTELVDGLVDTDQEALEPLIDALNVILGGDTAALTDLFAGLAGGGDNPLTGLLGGLGLPLP